MSTVVFAVLALLLGFATPAVGSPAEADPGPRTCGVGDAPAPGTVLIGRLPSGGVDRYYRAHIPSSYTPDRPAPVLIGLHGRGTSAEAMERDSGLSVLDAVVVYPQALVAPDGQTAWSGAPYSPDVDDVGFVRDLIDHLDARLCVDTARVYAVGLSNGGGFAAMLGCRLADRLAGYATVAGAFYPEAGECTPSRPLPLLNFHGTADPVVPYEGDPAVGKPPVQRWLEERAVLNRCQGRAPVETPFPEVELEKWNGCAARVAHYRIVDGGHEWPNRIDTPGLIWSFFTGAG